MVPLDKAFVSSYRLSIVNNVAIWSGLAAVCNAKFPPAFIETVCYLFTLLVPEVVGSRLILTGQNRY